MRRSKYGNKKVKAHSQVFDSAKEARRFQELHLLGKFGKITDLRTQVAFELIPAQYEDIPTGEVYVRGEKKGQPKLKRTCVEKSVKYIADFVYYENGKMVVEDTKSEATKTPEYIIKRKLMRYIHGIKIKEI